MKYKETKSEKVVINGIFKEKMGEHSFPDYSPFNPNSNSYIGDRALILTWNEIKGVVESSEDSTTENNPVSKIKLIRDMERFIINGLLKGDTIGNIGYKSNVINTGDKSSTFTEGPASVTINSGDRSVSMDYGNYSAAVNTGNESISRTLGDCSISSTTGHNSVSVGLGNLSVSTSTGIRSASVSRGIQGVSLCTGCNSISEVILKRSVAITSDKKSISLARSVESVSLSTGSESISVCEKQRSVAICTGKNSSAKVEEDGIAFGFGEGSIVSGRLGSWLVLVDQSCGIKNVVVVQVDGSSIKPGTWYMLGSGGDVIEASEKKVRKQTSIGEEVYRFYFLYHGNKKKYRGCYCCVTSSKTVEGAKAIVNDKFRDGSWKYFGDEKEWTNISSLKLPPSPKFANVKCYADVWGLREVKI